MPSLWQAIAPLYFVVSGLQALTSTLAPQQQPQPQPVLPGASLGSLAARRGLLLGTDLVDTWPQPYKTDVSYAALAAQQFR